MGHGMAHRQAGRSGGQQPDPETGRGRAFDPVSRAITMISPEPRELASLLDRSTNMPVVTAGTVADDGPLIGNPIAIRRDLIRRWTPDD